MTDPRSRRPRGGHGQAEGAGGPPGQVQPVGGCPDLVEGAVGRGSEVDRRGVAGGRVVPGGGEELVAGRHQVVGLRRRTSSGSHIRTSGGASAGPLRASASTRVSIPSASTGASASIPSTAIPSASLAHISASSGCCSASAAARARTVGVSSSSRQGGAQSPWRATSSERWSETRKYLISSTSSPQNSTRSGCSSVGGKTSRIPPRIGELAALLDQVGRDVADAYQRLRQLVVRDLGARADARRAAGRRAPVTIGWRSARTGATTRSSAPIVSSSGSGCASRRSTARRRPTVSELGLSRSCGRVSHAGSTATRAVPRRLLGGGGEVLGLAGRGGHRQDQAVAGHAGGEEGDRGVGCDDRAVRTLSAGPRARRPGP